jgi:pimeloyl-ACP methyl ester carboxylesterase
MKWGRIAVWSLFLLAGGCADAWRPDEPTAEEYDHGLIVLYPGVYNTHDEMLSLYAALRAAGIDKAIEVQTWGPPFDVLRNVTAYDEHHDWAKHEATRLLGYINDHPDRPVDLIGFSGGAAIAIWATEALPPDTKLDRIILLNAGISPDYDLTPALDRTNRGVVHYYSTVDTQTMFVVSLLGLMDGVYAVPAGNVGFSQSADNLIQFPYTPQMVIYGNFGNHADILTSPLWFSACIVPFVLDEPEAQRADIPGKGE